LVKNTPKARLVSSYASATNKAAALTDFDRRFFMAIAMGARSQILLYLALVVVGSAVFDTLIIRGGGLVNPATGNLVTAVMWTPAFAAIVTQLMAKRTLAGLGWWPRRWAPLVLGWFAPIVYGGLPFLVAVLLGAGSFTAASWTHVAVANGLPASPLAGLAFMVIVGTGISLFSATGEEIGWRGFLVPALGERFGFWGVSLVSAVIWTAYHLPLIFLAGYSGQGVPLAYSLVCFCAMVVTISPLLTALRLRSGSFWPTALMHASHNLFIQSVFAGAVTPNAMTPWLVGEFGALTAPIGAALAWLYLWRTGLPRTVADEALAQSQSN
jgi:membrane protease YdiL (CAAX protease family)